YLPFNPNPVNTMTGAVDPTYNPYVTIDYIQNVPIRSNTPNPPAAPYKSRGKTQPYAALTLTGANAANSPVVDQTGTQVVSNVISTFGNTNAPLPPSGHYDWLVHLDRQVISPMELLHVSGYQPYQLTQRFLLGSDNLSNAANAVNPPNPANAFNIFGHYVPWLDAPPGPIANMSTPWWFDASLAGATPPQSHRLYRLFEFLECGGRAAGTSSPNSIPGKVNINTIWDPEIFRAICDANLSIGLPPDDSITDQIFQQLIASRSTNLANNTIGPVNIATGSLPTSYQLDRPFLPFSTGLSAAGQLGQPGQQYPNGAGIQDTILRPNPSSNTLRLLQNPSDTSNI